MVANAKEYNMPGSEIFQDAERIRKMTYNFMKQHGIAKERNNATMDTPMPDAQPEKTTKLRLTAPKPASSAKSESISKTDSPAPRQPTRSESAKIKEDVSTNDFPKEELSTKGEKTHIDSERYTGLGFQEAQEKIITDCMEYVAPDSELTVFEPFIQLPSRQLKDYYAIIKRPTSLKQIMKKVHGWQSREQQTGVTDFRTWDSFENEVARIWDNARIYNEDGSEMSLLADEFEKEFKGRLVAAKNVVDEPEKPKIKLNMGEAKPTPTGLKLKLGNQKQSPAPNPNTPTLPTSGSPPSGTQATTGGTQATQPNARAGSGRPGSSQARSTASPALSTKTPNGIPPSQPTPVNGVMPPPSGQARPTSSNSSYPAMPPPSGIAQNQHYVPPSFPQVMNSFDSKWRPKPAKSTDGTTAPPDILMSKLHVATHPDLPVKKPLKVAVEADKTLSQQSITTSVGPQHTVLRLTTELADQLKGTNARAYRLFVSNNGIRQSQRVVHDYSNLSNGLVNGLHGGNNAPQKEKGPSWDVRLQPGTNRIEVECVAAAKQGCGNNDLVMEKVSLFIFQMKA